MNQNSQLYDAKSGLYGEYYNAYLIPYVPDNSKVLDVGCNNGKLGEQLIKKKNCTVYGLDVSPQAIKEAKKRIHFARVMDVERGKIPFSNELFDVIIFGDVLEHLSQPEAVLQKFKGLLRNEGFYLVSLPNVANITIRIKLLFGRWEYKASGICDNTHLRFFTLKSAMEMFKRNRFQVVAVDSSPGFDFFISGFFVKLQPVTDRICRIWPKLFANQFIFKIRPNWDEINMHL